MAAIALTLLYAGCSTPDSPTAGSGAASSSATEPAAPYTGYPDSVAAIGHSAVTGEGTDTDGGEAKENSWATGTNPEVDSIYLRILRDHPDVEGHAVNLGAGSADVTALAGQARQLITQEPQPELVLIATLDADIKCPAELGDYQAYGQALRTVLEELATQMPASRFFITTQISTPTRDLAIYSRQERATLGGTGPCAFLDTKGNVVPQELKRLESSVAEFKKQVTAACSQSERCETDQTGQGWTLERADYSEDLNHMSIRGQARWAEHVWGLLGQAELVPTR